MSQSKFKRCLWLVNTVRSFGPLTFEAISRRWESSSLNDDGEPLSKKSFHNYIDAVAEMFDINIVCERKNGYTYHIDIENHQDRWIANFIDSLILQSAISVEPDLRSRILDYDVTYASTPSIGTIFDALSSRRPISFHLWINMEVVRKARKEGTSPIEELIALYPKEYNLKAEIIPIDDIHRDFTGFYPLYVIRANNTWYVLGAFSQALSLQFAVYDVMQMHDIRIEKDAPKVNLPKDFDIEDYIACCVNSLHGVLGKYQTEMLDDASTTLGADIRGLSIVREMKTRENTLKNV